MGQHHRSSFLEGLLKQVILPVHIICFLLFPSSSSRTAMPPSSHSTPSGPSTRTATAPSTSESSSARCPSHHEAASSRSSTGPSTCTTWMETERSHEWRCWRSSRYHKEPFCQGAGDNGCHCRGCMLNRGKNQSADLWYQSSHLINQSIQKLEGFPASSQLGNK